MRPNPGGTFHRDVSADLGEIADGNIFTKDLKRADSNSLSQLGLAMDDGGRMD